MVLIIHSEKQYMRKDDGYIFQKLDLPGTKIDWYIRIKPSDNIIGLPIRMASKLKYFSISETGIISESEYLSEMLK